MAPFREKWMMKQKWPVIEKWLPWTDLRSVSCRQDGGITSQILSPRLLLNTVWLAGSLGPPPRWKWPKHLSWLLSVWRSNSYTSSSHLSSLLHQWGCRESSFVFTISFFRSLTSLRCKQTTWRKQPNKSPIWASYKKQWWGKKTLVMVRKLRQSMCVYVG